MMNNEQTNPIAPHPPCFIHGVNAQPFFHGSLFSGIGGFDLASEWAGWENAFHCEWNEFGQKILKHYWPNAESYGDITKTDFTIWRGRIDILSGGFPCQPYSLAGKRKGKEDERHLWPSMLRAIREISPRYIVGENVPGLVNWDGGLVFNEVQTDLEAAGYEVQPVILPACAVNAPHKRERVWFVAYARDNGQHGTKNRQSHFKGNDDNATGANTIEQFTGCGYEATGKTIAYANSTPTRNKIQARGNMPTSNVLTNTRCSERENWLHGKEQGGEAAKFGDSYTKFGRFAQFPTTEPTIRWGNDGISTKLDGITFPKWRNESIKGFGNAIVPQVAYQIFNAINLHAATCGWR